MIDSNIVWAFAAGMVSGAFIFGVAQLLTVLWMDSRDG